MQDRCTANPTEAGKLSFNTKAASRYTLNSSLSACRCRQADRIKLGLQPTTTIPELANGAALKSDNGTPIAAYERTRLWGVASTLRIKQRIFLIFSTYLLKCGEPKSDGRSDEVPLHLEPTGGVGVTVCTRYDEGSLNPGRLV